MGLLSDFFIAERDGIPEYDCGPDFPEEDRCQFKWITPLEAAGILAVLRRVDDRIELMSEFRLVTPETAEEWTMTIPQDMVVSLAELTAEEMPAIAQQCADVTAEELGWDANEFAGFLGKLSALARRAVETERAMYLWNCL